MVACANEKTENTEEIEMPLETVSLEQLVSDLENPAKAKLNDGKQTTVYGQIEQIHTDSFLVNTFVDISFGIEAETKILAELERDHFVIADVVIDSELTCGGTYQSRGLKIQALKDTETKEKMDQYVRDLISKAIRPDAAKYHLEKDDIKQNTNEYLLFQYMYSRGDVFQKKTDQELEAFLVGGTWHTDTDVYGQVKFYSNGTYDRHYWYEHPYFSDKWNRWRDSHSEWSVENGYIDAFWYNKPAVYILTNNLCFFGSSAEHDLVERH